MNIVNRNCHTLSIEETLQSLNSSHQGLSQEEAARRLAQFGPNELKKEKGISPIRIFLSQFTSFLILVLLAAVVISFAIGEIIDALMILLIVLFAGILGFIQEYRAEKAMEALKKMAALTSSVIRDGAEKETPARELVPGDVVLLITGDRVPADCRLIESRNLKIDEAPLTGESVPVEKTTEIFPQEASIGDRRNMAYSGTTIVYGRGKALVTDTGMHTEFGKIAAMLQEQEEKRTPLQVNLDRLGRIMGIGALAVAALVGTIGFLSGAFTGDTLLEKITAVFIWSVSLAVATVPEALPAVVTISLALGVRRMVKRHVLVRKLPAVETLGSTTVICSDKTGTLTQDEMTVRQIYYNNKTIQVTGSGYEPKGKFYQEKLPPEEITASSLSKLLIAGALCNDSRLLNENGVWAIKGDPTEGSLVVLSVKGGLRLDKINDEFPRIDEIPFSSERKKMTTVHKSSEGIIAFSKGAAQIILDSCNRIYLDGKEQALAQAHKDKILEEERRMAGNALRVLGLSYKPLDEKVNKDYIEQDMVFLGLTGMIDPPRPEVKLAIEQCHQAGIKTVMITGDHKITAVAIARELGLLGNGMALSGTELDALSEEEYEKLVEKIHVYARVSPTHKMRVVEALSRKGHIVAMTGDGVNDAPALKKSHIGIAMGITGTDVTKETADMILTDDNFASIVAAVEEGRGLFENIKKYLMYLLTSNLGEILVMASVILLGPLLGLPPGVLPLIAIQILYVNLATDGLPALALSVDPAEKDIMRRPPRRKGEGIFTPNVIKLILTGGLWSAIVNTGIFLWALLSGRSILEAQALTFLTLTIIQFFKAYNFRSDRHSILNLGAFNNKWLNLSILANLLMLTPIIYLPFLQGPFHTFALGWQDWVIVILTSATIVPVIEIAKFFIRRKIKNENKK